jgi:carbamoyltransferase
MYVLGISFLADCGVALVKDGKLLEAVNEERFSRIKLHKGIPDNSIKYIFNKYGLNWQNIDYVATHGALDDDERHSSFFKEKEKEIISSELKDNKEDQLIRLWTRYAHEKYVRDIRTPNYIGQITQHRDDVKVYHHHLCHAIAAYQQANIDEAYVLTIDGWGEDGSALFGYAKDGEINVIDYSPTFCSLGYLYGSITKLLGFKPHQHEGKILGLSARGSRDAAYPVISKMIRYNHDKKRFDGLYELGVYVANYNNPNLAVLDGNSREDIAAGVQRVLEETVLDFVRE